MQTLAALVAEWIVLVFIAGVGAIVLAKLWAGTINLAGLLSEPATGAEGGGTVAIAPPGGTAVAAPGAAGGAAAVAPAGAAVAAAPGPAAPGMIAVSGKASVARFQLLLFTFVIAGLYLTLSLEAGYLIEIPNQVLGLLGISGASYVVSKGIQQQAAKPGGAAP
jgi:hypothetical protein